MKFFEKKVSEKDFKQLMWRVGVLERALGGQHPIDAQVYYQFPSFTIQAQLDALNKFRDEFITHVQKHKKKGKK